MTKITYHNDKKFESFSESFKDCVATKLDNLYEIDVTFFVDQEDVISSLSMNVMKYNDTLYKISNIVWQEEGVDYGYRSVCHNTHKDGYVLYHFETDTIMDDVYLDDKYGECSDGYFSEKLETMFHECPDVLPNLVDDSF